MSATKPHQNPGAGNNFLKPAVIGTSDGLIIGLGAVTVLSILFQP
jgi:hypothetical protein